MIYYFEMKVLNKGEKGRIGIGLTANESRLDRMPGWEKFGLGYNGYNGNFYYESGSRKAYGPTFSTDDVIGCGFDMENGDVFFTKNGELLGIAKSSLPKNIWYPTIGLHSENEAVEVNFGQGPFVYNLYRHSSKTFKDIIKFVFLT
jgi:hypothetical protein